MTTHRCPGSRVAAALHAAHTAAPLDPPIIEGEKGEKEDGRKAQRARGNN